MKDAPHAPEAAPPGLRVWMVLAALGLGLLQALGFGMLAHWSVNLIALTLMLILLQTVWAAGPRPGISFALGWFFGLAHFSFGLAWLHHSMHHIGGMPFALSVLAVLLFAAYLALFSGLAFGLAGWAQSRRCNGRSQGGARFDMIDTLVAAAALASGWWLMEAARGWLFTGFPWLSVGYGQIDGPLAAVASITGVHGVSALAVFMAALAARGLGPATHDPVHRSDPVYGSDPKRHVTGLRIKSLALASGLLLVLQFAPPGPQHWVAPAGPPLTVRLLQGNVAQSLKFEPQRTLQAMNDYLEDFERGDARFTLLPEIAWTVPWSMTPPELVRRILDRVQSGHHLAMGLPRWREPDSLPTITTGTTGTTGTTSTARPQARALPANSVMLITPESAPLLNGLPDERSKPAPALHSIPIYDKHHLVPFGEFIPWGFGWFVRQMQIPLGDFARGAPVQPPFEVDGQRIAMNICYEDLFGQEIRLPVLQERATILANVSNLGWFGRSSALEQHLAISRFRSLETGRPMLRATNTGMTAVIDHQGRVLGRLEPHARGALDATVQGMTGLTPYVRFGQLPWLIACALVLALIGRLPRSGLSRRRPSWRRPLP